MIAGKTETDLSSLVDVVVSGNLDQMIATARSYVERDQAVDQLIGHIAMIGAQGDPVGQRTISLAAASMLSRLLAWIPAPVERPQAANERALPLLVQALKIAQPILPAGREALAHVQYPQPLFPSELLASHKRVNDVMREAVDKQDVQLAERALLGLYGTGADYRTMQVRAYEAIATTFQNSGYPLILAVRGFQLLDAVEWGDRAPNIIHWLAPHLILHSTDDEPAWIQAVRAYTADSAHSLTGIRTRLSAPKDENALPLRDILLSNADTTQVCQSIYDTLIKGEASTHAVASVIVLAAVDYIQSILEYEDHQIFWHAAHGLLFAAAVRCIFRQVQDIEVLNLLFTSAAYIHALRQEIAVQQPQEEHGQKSVLGGGLIAASQLETLVIQLKARDLRGAQTTAQRYLKIGHEPRALFGTIGLSAALLDTESIAGHHLQIVQAAAEAFLAWPKTLAGVDRSGLLEVALRAALLGKQDPVIAQL